MSTRFGRLAQSFERYKVYRTTLNELNNLGDRELNDLGLQRSNFREIARNAAYRR
ncbi:MAG: DUF1127 domain-containing protein [Pseudomonadota bacterium]